MFLDFVACSVHVIYVMYLLVVAVVFLCWMLNALHEDSSCEKILPDCWLWKLRYSWRLFAGGILAYEKHTWCWGGYFRFTVSQARLFTCAAMQPMLSGVAVRGRIWHAAHALAHDKSVLSSLWRKNQVDYYGEPRNSRHLFLKTLKHAYFLKSGRKKWYIFLCTNGRFRIYVYVHVRVHACGPKTVLVKRMFLENALSEVMVGWGGGGLSTFLVHRTLYVATLQRSLVQLLRYMLLRCSWWGGVGGAFQRSLYFVRYMLLRCSSYVICCYAAEISDVVATFYVATFDKISCHTGTIDAAWSAVKDFIPNSSCSKSKDLLLSVKCWQRRYVNLHTRLQQKTISTLKRLLWKEKKKCPIKCQNPSRNARNANLAKFSRKNLAKFSSYQCAFRCSENNI